MCVVICHDIIITVAVAGVVYIYLFIVVITGFIYYLLFHINTA